LRQEWGLKPGDFTVLLPARITPWKGHEVALRAAERLNSVGTGFAPNLQLIFAGDAQAREGYLAQLCGEISRRGVSSMVRFVGHCADMPAAYCVADAVLSASTRPEAFGRTIAEAGAMERVVIAADHGGAREIVEDATTGILFPTGDDAALAEAIEGIARTPAAERAEMGARARRRIAEKFSLDAMQRATLEVYGELLS
jgi:glycosyltransferase involved in cell wall biosynthesis